MTELYESHDIRLMSKSACDIDFHRLQSPSLVRDIWSGRLHTLMGSDMKPAYEASPKCACGVNFRERMSQCLT